jgi:hypothetical protein
MLESLDSYMFVAAAVSAFVIFMVAMTVAKDEGYVVTIRAFYPAILMLLMSVTAHFTCE